MSLRNQIITAALFATVLFAAAYIATFVLARGMS